MNITNFKSGKNLAKATRILLLLTAIFTGVFAIIRVTEYFLFFRHSVVNKSDSSYVTFSLFLGVFSLVVILLSYATPIVFLIWQHRAAKNLLSLNESAITNSPGWNVGWWFIPFASLVMPFQCIRELLNGSRSENALDNSYVAGYAKDSIVGLWWFFYICSGFIGIATAFLGISVINNPQNMSYLAISLVISHSFSVIAALLVRKIVLMIDDAQEESYKLFDQKRDFLNPPAPPTFE